MSYLQVEIRDPDDFERLFKKWCRMAKKDGFLAEIRERRYFKKPSEKKREERQKMLRQHYRGRKNAKKK